MSQLILQGDPKLLAKFDKDLMEEFATFGLSNQVTVETKTIEAPLAPGELGFGEEIRQILVGVADVLKASKDAINTVAEGLAKRLVQRKLSIKVEPNGVVSIKAAGSLTNVSEVTEKFAEVLKVQLSSNL